LSAISRLDLNDRDITLSNAPLITEPELAKILKTSQRSIRNARQSGALSFILIGRLVRYRMEDVNAFLANAVVTNDVPDQVTMNVTASTKSKRNSRIVGFLEKNRVAA